MKFYNLETEFNFGKYEGKTVRQIIDIQLSYLNWCALKLDHFYMDENDVDEVKSLKPNFSFTNEEQQSLDNKYSKWKAERELKKQSRNSNYTRNWLEDASGSDDPETMNDAYWNLD